MTAIQAEGEKKESLVFGFLQRKKSNASVIRKERKVVETPKIHLATT